jgi:hypothetical protein
MWQTEARGRKLRHYAKHQGALGHAHHQEKGQNQDHQQHEAKHAGRDADEHQGGANAQQPEGHEVDLDGDLVALDHERHEAVLAAHGADGQLQGGAN